ncbi:hypothetical protein B0H12DRAFT_1124968 [Mycena haematopus]|nr:hypothetical protein B0H12DRAFT_1124968 [Mycena haematopus]
MYFTFWGVLGLAFLLANAYPSLGKETNASRLKRGLPPLPPRFLMRQNRATASATISAIPSYTQLSATRSSRIQVFAGNGSSFGYVKNSAPILGVNLDADSSQDLRVQGVTGEPFSIYFESPKFLGAPLQPGALASRHLRDFTKSSNKERSGTVSHNDLVRTVVWSIDSKTRELRALYRTGTKSPILAYDAVGNKLYFVGDIGIYNSANSDFLVIPVRFYLSED